MVCLDAWLRAVEAYVVDSEDDDDGKAMLKSYLCRNSTRNSQSVSQALPLK